MKQLPKSDHPNRKPIAWTEELIQEALRENRAIGKLWDESFVRSNEQLARCLIMRSMRHSGSTYKSIAIRFNLYPSGEGVRLILSQFERKVGLRIIFKANAKPYLKMPDLSRSI